MTSERTISPANASGLIPVWNSPYKTKAVIEGSLAAVNGTLYFGDYHGNVTALNASNGQVRWSIEPGAHNDENHSWTDCFSAAQSNVRGITATPTIWNNTAYLPGGNGSLLAINVTTHAVKWWLNLTGGTHDNWTSFYIWGSPLIYQGFLYIGTASGCDLPLVQGEVKQINLVENRTYPTIAVRHVFTVVQNNSTAGDTGGSVWSTPSVDPNTGSIYITSGSESQLWPPKVPGTTYNWTQAVVRLAQSNFCSPSTLQGCSTSGYYHLNASGAADFDFGAGATVFHDDHGVTMVGALNKNGSFYAFYQSDLTPGGTGKYAWNYSIAKSGAPAGKNIAPAAFDGSSLYIAGYSTVLPNGTDCSNGAIRSLNATTGSQNWGACLPGFVHAGVTYANGLVYVAALWQNSTKAWNSTLDVFNSTSGLLLYTRNLNGTIDGEPVVADGRVFVTVGNFHTLCGNGTPSSPCAPGYVYAFGLPMAVKITVPGSYCLNSPHPCNPWISGIVNYTASPSGGTPPYSCYWTFGDGSHGSGCVTSHEYDYSPTGVNVFSVSVQVTDSSYEGITGFANLWAATGSNVYPSLGIDWLVAFTNCGIAAHGCPPSMGSDTINFFTLAFGGTPGYSYNWTFGDLGSSSLQNPVHTYASVGTYTVTLTVKDQRNHTATLSLRLTT
jgi:outer membrane protein assembly factor BamB